MDRLRLRRYLWATEPVPSHRLEEEGYRVARRIDGIPILDDSIRLTWSLAQVTVWIQVGPIQDSIGPRPSQLSRLVKAGKAITLD